jgi:hypothetical protein
MPATVLRPPERAIVEALGQAFFPLDGALSPDARRARVADYVDRYLAACPPLERQQLRALFLLFELAWPLYGKGGGLRFSRAPEPAQADYLLDWGNSPLYPRRAMFLALRSVFTLAYCADPEVERQMGVADGAEAVRRSAGRRESPAPGSPS